MTSNSMKSLFVFLLCALTSVSVLAGPKVREVKLGELNTSMVVPVIPDLGVRFVFPFLLNENSSIIPFSVENTNENAFKINRPADEKIEHNSFVVTVNIPAAGFPAEQVYRGTLFIHAGGYLVTVRLETSGDDRKYFDDIVFNFPADKRDYLINEAIDMHTVELEKKYAEKVKGLDLVVKEELKSKLAFVALEKPTHIPFRKSFSKKLENGDRVKIFVDKAISYDSYDFYVFEIENPNSRSFRIQGIQLGARKAKKDQLKIADNQYYCPKTIDGDRFYRCAMVTTDQGMKEERWLSMLISTDRGQVQVEWQ